MAAISVSDPSALPSQFDITLLLKHHKSTTLLSVAPSQSFSEIKSLLLSALRSRGVGPIPADPEEFEFGILADKRDTSKGWTSLESLGSSKDKRKAANRTKVAAGADSPEAVGLGDGSLVAFRIRKPKKGKQREKDTEMDDDEEDGDIDMDDDPGWDVVLPTFDDEDPEAEAERMLAGMEGR